MYTKLASVPALSLAAYDANDVVGALLTFTFAGEAPPRSELKVKRLTLVDAAIQSEEFILYLFNASPAANARTDAAAFAPVAADLAKMIGSIHIAAADYVAGNACSVVLKELDFPIVLPAGAKAFYGVLVGVATPDYAAATDLTLTLVVEI